MYRYEKGCQHHCDTTSGLDDQLVVLVMKRKSPGLLIDALREFFQVPVINEGCGQVDIIHGLVGVKFCSSFGLASRKVQRPGEEKGDNEQAEKEYRLRVCPENIFTGSHYPVDIIFFSRYKVVSIKYFIFTTKTQRHKDLKISTEFLCLRVFVLNLDY